jgi:hypothetical protein
MCKDTTEDIRDGFLGTTIQDRFEPKLCCGSEKRETNVPNMLHWIQGKGYSFPVDLFHRKSPWDWQLHWIQGEFCCLCQCPEISGLEECPMAPLLHRVSAEVRAEERTFLKDPTDEWIRGKTM